MRLNLQDSTTVTWLIISIIVVVATVYSWVAIRNTPPQMAFTTAADYRFPYRISPETGTRMELGDELTEISGITSLDKAHVLAIQDEKGIIYTVELATGAIVDRLVFDKDRDYEDVCLVGDYAFVLERDGDLYQRHLTLRDTTRKFETPFSYRNDVEALCYDARHNRLLIMPKEGAPDSMEIGENMVGVYGFDLTTLRMERQTIVTIAEKELGSIIGNGGKPHTFKPSGIAIHPGTGYLYVLASVGKALVVVDMESNKIMHVQLLDPRQFPQPEGIAFDAAGNLLISSEGTSTSPGLIIRFQPTVGNE
jgi:uncharacterized protein YjiK